MHFIFRLIGSVLRHSIVPAIFLAAGWYGGAKHGAPDLLIRAVDGAVARAQVVLSPLVSQGVEKGGEIAADAAERGGELAVEAAQEGGEAVADVVEQALEDLAEAPGEESQPTDSKEASEPEEVTAEEEAPASEASEPEIVEEKEPESEPEPAPAPAPVSSATDNGGDIVLCPGMNIANAPRADANGLVRQAGAKVRYKGVDLLLMPATKSCLSSGYGNRNGRLHKGVDYHTQENGMVLAAGDGVIAEAVSRSDYGNMIVIDHGNGVYTRYAHLARFGSGVREGASVASGQVLGPIGTSGASRVIHLHWEILEGDISAQAGSFGLEPVNPFSLPAAQ